MRNLFKSISLIALVAVFGVSVSYAHCGACASNDAAHHTVAKKGVPDIDHASLKRAIADGEVFLIDVNGTSSFRNGHIPGAVDFASVGKTGLAKVLPKNKSALIVAYCGGPGCGAYKKAAKAAVALGYTDVHHYSGGIRGWKDAGESVDSVEG